MSTLNVTTIQTANGTTDLTLTTGNTIGPSIVVGANGSFTYSNVNSFSVGANVTVTTSTLSIGNSTVNTVANSTTVTTSTLSIGNSTVNTVANSTTVTTSALSIGNSTVNSVVNNTTLAIGNTTVNVAITQNTLRIGNSTATFTVASNGNVGIGGNTTPTLDLYVNGAAAGAVGTLSDDANVAVDLSTFNNFTLTLNGARNLDNPTNLIVGQSGIIWVSQNSTGGQTLSYGSFWKFPANTAPTLTSTASAVDALVYSVRTSTSITVQAILNVG
jgi:hypothetical protein